jgi:hypothetical protein
MEWKTSVGNATSRRWFDHGDTAAGALVVFFYGIDLGACKNIMAAYVQVDLDDIE